MGLSGQDENELSDEPTKSKAVKGKKKASKRSAGKKRSSVQEPQKPETPAISERELDLDYIKKREERLVELKNELDEKRYETETRLVSQFNTYLSDREEDIKKKKDDAVWDMWLSQSGRPDILSAKSITSFVSMCIESDTGTESVFSQCAVANDLIRDIKNISIDYPSKPEYFANAIEKLNLMKEKRIDQLTLSYLKEPDKYIDAQSDDLLHEFTNEDCDLSFMLWANSSKNARRRKVEFGTKGVKIELTKPQCTNDVGVRVYYTNEDNLSVLMPEYIQVNPLKEPTLPMTAKSESATEPVNDIDPDVPDQNKSETALQSRAGSKIDSAGIAASVNLGSTSKENPEHCLDIDPQSLERKKLEPVGLDGKSGIGGVWHIDFLRVPEPPKTMNNWKIRRSYSEELQKTGIKTDSEGKGIEIALPVPSNPSNKPLSVGIWNKETQRWEDENIVINEEKDGSIYFTAQEAGAFRFFIDRHQNEEKPLVETWLMRPHDEIIEFHYVLQNYKLLFEVLPSGKINLIEQHNPKILNDEQKEVDLETLIVAMEDQSLFVFPTDESFQFLDYIEKDEYVLYRTYQNMCSVAHGKEFKTSSYNPMLGSNRVAACSADNTVLCDEEKLYIIEDQYLPPAPPEQPFEEGSEENQTDEAFREEMEKYELRIKTEADRFKPDFEIPREGEKMEATLDQCLKCESRINEQNLTIYKLLLKSKIFNF